MKTIRYTATLLAFATITLPWAATAQQPGFTTIEEIVVTARRREETLQTVPIPVTALSSDDMRGRAIQDMTDLSRVTPNLQFDSAGNNRNAALVFLRGIGQVNWGPTQDPKIGTYLDGVYLGRPLGGVFDLVDVERVEVLRGPQGTLFGRNTTAGLVHVITKKPGPEFDAEVIAGAGNDGQLKFGGMLNIPISDTLFSRFSLQHQEADGYVKNTGAGKDWNNENSQIARGSLLWEPSDRFDARLTADYQRVRERASLGTCQWTGPEDGMDSAAEGGFPFFAWIFGVYDEVKDTCNGTIEPDVSGDNDPDDESEIDAWGLNLTFNWDLGFATLTSISSYGETDDFNGSWGFGSDNVGTASYLEVLGVDTNNSDQWSQELRLTGVALNDSLDWTAGVYAFSEDTESVGSIPVFRNVAAPDCADVPQFCFPSPIPGFDTLGDFALFVQLTGSRDQVLDATNSSWALFSEVTYHFLEDFSLTAGVRYTEDERDFTRSQVLSAGIPDFTLVCPGGSPPQGGTTCKQTESFDEWTPRFILSYQWTDDVMIYGGWSKGYSSGGFNSDVRMRPYEPEISKNWEAGVKSQWWDNRLTFNLTGFFNEYEEQQIIVPRIVDGQPTADQINAQDAEIWGIEGDFALYPTERLMIAGSFGWVDGEYQEFTVFDNLIGPPPDFEEIIVERDLSDTEVIRGPDYTYSITAAYTLNFGQGHELVEQVGWSYRGRSYNTLESLNSSRQDGYGLLDARVTWYLPNGKTSISLSGTNLLDEEYFSSAIDLSGGTAPISTITKYWGEPRRYLVEIRHSLGTRGAMSERVIEPGFGPDHEHIDAVIAPSDDRSCSSVVRRISPTPVGEVGR